MTISLLYILWAVSCIQMALIIIHLPYFQNQFWNSNYLQFKVWISLYNACQKMTVLFLCS